MEPTHHRVELHLVKELPPTATDSAWADVMHSCWNIMQSRQRDRKDVWRRSGARGMAHEVLAKSERLFYNLMSSGCSREEAEKELVDIINYAAFCLIQIRDANLNGDWPWPK